MLMKLRIVALIGLYPALLPVLVAAEQSHAHWGYDGKDGPRAWATLSPEYAECGRGSRQSPIDLPIAAGPEAPRAPAAEMKVYHHEHSVDVSNNGHTVTVSYDDGDQLALGESVYPLVQYHFHTPSEHTFAGQHFPGELHLVHRAANGQLAVVGVMLESGTHNAAFDAVVGHLPSTAGASEHVDRVPVDIDALLPASRQAFRYAGSLTTPPCSEGVEWLVLRAPAGIDPQQLQSLAAVLQHNNRDTQALHGRAVSSTELDVESVSSRQ